MNDIETSSSADVDGASEASWIDASLSLGSAAALPPAGSGEPEHRGGETPKACLAAPSWALMASAKGAGGQLRGSVRPRVLVPPIVRRQAPPKAKAAPCEDDEGCFED